MTVHSLDIPGSHWLSTTTEGGRLNCIWPSPAQLFVASGLIEIHDQDFCSLLDMYVFEKWGLPFDEGRGRSFSGGAAFVAPQFQHEYVQVPMGTAHPLHLECSLYNIGTDRIENTITKNASIVAPRARCRGNLYIEPLPSNGPGVFRCLSSRCLATAVSFNHPVTLLLAYFPILQNRVGLWDQVALCVCLYIPPIVAG
jgi:hypothetical protein